jgi:hypothetical protein
LGTLLTWSKTSMSLNSTIKVLTKIGTSLKKLLSWVFISVKKSYLNLLLLDTKTGIISFRMNFLCEIAKKKCFWNSKFNTFRFKLLLFIYHLSAFKETSWSFLLFSSFFLQERKRKLNFENWFPKKKSSFLLTCLLL